MIYILYGVILWFIVFSISSSIVFLLVVKGFGKKNEIYIGIVTQVLFLIFSYTMVLLINEPYILDYKLFMVNKEVVMNSIYLSIGVLIYSIITNLLNNKLIREDSIFIEFTQGNKYAIIFTLLLLAPIGEETLFRGLLEGYYIFHKTPLLETILIPAILFALIHIAPFKKLSRTTQIILLTQVFIIGLILSYYRTVIPSLIPVIIAHASANLGGFITYYLIKK